jgi:hypothetical protein
MVRKWSLAFVLFCGITLNAVERTDMGICGGRANYYAWDDVNKLMYAGVEAAMNLFVSADSGVSWSLAYPADSLKSGWSNDCRVIRSEGGITIAVVGGGQKCIITRDGAKTWNQLMTQQSVQSVVSGAGIQGSVQNVSNVIMRFGKIYLLSGNLILTSSDTGTTWAVTVFPDSSAKSATNDTKKNIADLIPLNDQGSHVLAIATDPGSRNAKLYESTDGKVFTIRTLTDSSVIINAGDSPKYQWQQP